MITIDLKSSVPIYEQLYKKISELIIKGILSENDQLPGVRTLAKDLGVNPNTVSKAYQELERNGIIYSVSGRGCFVAAVDHSAVREGILEDFDKAVRDAEHIERFAQGYDSGDHLHPSEEAYEAMANAVPEELF